jgi:hypothetical protein
MDKGGRGVFLDERRVFFFFLKGGDVFSVFERVCVSSELRCFLQKFFFNTIDITFFSRLLSCTAQRTPTDNSKRKIFPVVGSSLEGGVRWSVHDNNYLQIIPPSVYVFGTSIRRGKVLQYVLHKPQNKPVLTKLLGA